MLYTKRTVRCSARGLNREQARISLERQFEGTELLDIKRRGDKWVATLLEPKTAEFPPSKDDDSDSEAPPESESSDGGSEDSASPDSDGGESDGPPKKEGPSEPKGEKAELAAALDLLHAIADHLGIVPGGAAPGAEDPLALDGPPAPPPGPPPGGAPGVGGPDHQEVVHRTKMKPGETPPGVTPIGAPAFASASISRMASFDAFDDTPGKTIKEAKAELEALYGPHGFTVRQIKRVEGGKRLAAKLSRR
jgi:hypothetical protein